MENGQVVLFSGNQEISSSNDPITISQYVFISTSRKTTSYLVSKCCFCFCQEVSWIVCLLVHLLEILKIRTGN